MLPHLKEERMRGEPQAKAVKRFRPMPPTPKFDAGAFAKQTLIVVGITSAVVLLFLLIAAAPMFRSLSSPGFSSRSSSEA